MNERRKEISFEFKKLLEILLSFLLVLFIYSNYCAYYYFISFIVANIEFLSMSFIHSFDCFSTNKYFLISIFFQK